MTNIIDFKSPSPAARKARSARTAHIAGHNSNTGAGHAQVKRLPLRTPYHSLGSSDEMRVPAWADQRSVYRSAGRTLYLVDTKDLEAAESDLRLLQLAGWNVQVAKDPAGSGARIALTRRDLARAA